MNDIERPFDLLDDLKGEEIRIYRKDKATVVGTLQAFDKHINVGLTDVRVYIPEKDLEKEEYHTDQAFVRGDMIINVEPHGGTLYE